MCILYSDKINRGIQEYKEFCFHAILAPTMLGDHKELDTVFIKVEGISPDKEKQKLKFKR